MPNINFFKGHSENLAKQPLRNGSIYFTPDTRHLYVDTATARVPITGDDTFGKIFNVQLFGSDFENGDIVVDKVVDGASFGTTWTVTAEEFADGVAAGKTYEWRSGDETVVLAAHKDNSMKYKDSGGMPRIDVAYGTVKVTTLGPSILNLKVASASSADDGRYLKITTLSGNQSWEVHDLSTTGPAFAEPVYIPEAMTVQIECFKKDNVTVEGFELESLSLTPYIDISSILTADSIIFTGNYQSENPATGFQYITCTNSTGEALTFNYSQGSVIENLRRNIIWVQIFTPNPNPLAYRTLINSFKSVYTTREWLLADPGWEKTEDGGFQYELIVDEVDLTTQPFFIQIYSSEMGSDQIEDYKVELIKYGDWVQSKITFYSAVDFDFNIAVDLAVVIADAGEWAQVEISLNNRIRDVGFYEIADNYSIAEDLEPNQYFLTGVQLNDVEDNIKRELIVFPLEESDWYNKIIDINYESFYTTDNIGIMTTFTDDVDLTEYKGNDTLRFVAIQLNNIANIHEVTLAANNWTDKGTFYIQQARANGEAIVLQNEHAPLIYPVNSSEFSKISEVKVHQRKVYFYSNSQFDSDLKVKVIDFI